MFEKFAEVPLSAWAVVVALVLVAVVMIVIMRGRQKWTTRMLTNAALCIALAFILSCIRLFRMPQGGSITAASMLPVFLFAYAYGAVPGLVTGIAYGILQFIQDAYFVHPIQIVLDYPLAFGLLALCAVGRKLPERYGLTVGIALGSLGRYVCATLSGVVFFADYAPKGQNPILYSMGYQASYLIPEMVICILICLIPQVKRTMLRLARETR